MTAPSPDAITVSVPARAEFVHVIRAVVGSAAGRHDLTIDAIDDLRIAVDEACAQLLMVHGTAVTVAIESTGSSIEILCVTDADPSIWPPQGVERTLAAQVLHGLTDEVAWERADGRPAVRLGKRMLGGTRGR